MTEPAISRISKIVDWLYDTVPTILPDHLELNDADDLFENPPAQLANGWGIAIGDGEKQERCVDAGSYYWRREFTLIITKDFIALKSDPQSRRKKQKLALEWTHQLLKLFGRTPSITDPANPTNTLSFKAELLRDSGPRQITVNDTPYLFVELTISLEYRELTT